ncbi:hypothetical protein Ahy_B05g078832 isoform D [Arachis hypogaea]|uniref:Uncharacterized protein n=1 Tax=Arachis hypogaea TaxID=3818 RepID=A0A444Z8C5_ARAHY|nr:hypothetical protein Ahy_B05g078832 isoform D [Arachis hypogaea]
MVVDAILLTSCKNRTGWQGIIFRIYRSIQKKSLSGIVESNGMQGPHGKGERERKMGGNTCCCHMVLTLNEQLYNWHHTHFAIRLIDMLVFQCYVLWDDA